MHFLCLSAAFKSTCMLSLINLNFLSSIKGVFQISFQVQFPASLNPYLGWRAKSTHEQQREKYGSVYLLEKLGLENCILSELLELRAPSLKLFHLQDTLDPAFVCLGFCYMLNLCVGSFWMERTLSVFLSLEIVWNCPALLFVYLKESCGWGFLGVGAGRVLFDFCIKSLSFFAPVLFWKVSLSIHVTQRQDTYLCFKCLIKILEPSRNVTLLSSCHQPSECCYSAVTVETLTLVVFNADAVLPWLANVCFCPACHVGFSRLVTRTKFTQYFQVNTTKAGGGEPLTHITDLPASVVARRGLVAFCWFCLG